MTHANTQTCESSGDASDADAAGLLNAMPHLGLLRKRQTPEELKQRALLTMGQMARLVLRKEFDTSDNRMAEAMVTKLIALLQEGRLLKKFDSDQGVIEVYLYGVMRNLALECFRVKRKERIEVASDMTGLCGNTPSPADAAAKREAIERVRQWAKALPPAQRDAVARRFEVLADLDSGSEIPNRYVALHRGLKRLRWRASEMGRKRRGG
jgi:hypothetical protein